MKKKDWKRLKKQAGLSAAMSKAFVCAFLSVVLLTGCGASGSAVTDMKAENYSSYDYSTDTEVAEEYISEGNYSGAEGGNYDETSAGQLLSDRKLIRNVNMDVETREYDLLMSTLERQVTELGGYVENMNSYNGSIYSGRKSTRSADLTIRIPQNKLDGFINAVSDVANVVRKSENVSDVTLTYVDLESNRDALKIEQTRLLELLEQASSLEDILTIEDRLTTVRYRLESMESQLRTMDNQVNYSTVYLSISEVEELTPVEEQTFLDKISEGFMDSLKDVAEDAVDLIIWFIVNIPHLIIWGAVIAIVVVLIRRRKKKKLSKNLKETASAENKADGKQD